MKALSKQFMRGLNPYQEAEEIEKKLKELKNNQTIKLN